MMVRLAFAVMVEADADIMLVDEVLAVGDAAFAQKCMDVFREKRRAGRTVVLVTHDMATVQGFCDRAMLLHDGELRYLGRPGGGRAALLPAQLRRATAARAGRGGVPDVNVRVVDAWLENEAGERVDAVEQGEPIGLERRVRGAARPRGARSSASTSSTRTAPPCSASTGRCARAGEAERCRRAGACGSPARIENPLAARPLLRHTAMISRNRTQGDLALHVAAAARLRRLRHAARAGERVRRRRRRGRARARPRGAP